MKSSQILSPPNVKQFAKYLVGGSLYFWTGYATFALFFSLLGWGWFWAKLVADLVGWTINYIVQRYWAFAGPRLLLSEIQHIERYVLITLVGFILDYLIVGGLYAMGVSPYTGFFVAAGFFTIWNFLWYRYWVFPSR